MPLFDLSLVAVVCVIWGVNFLVIKLALTETTPLILVTLRFALVVAVLATYLRPVPRRFGRVAAVAMLFGPVHFGCLFLGLSLANASTIALVILLYVPFAILFSMIFLHERPTPRRLIGVAVACAGTVLVAFNDEVVADWRGIACGVLSAAGLAGSTVLMPTLGGLRPLALQAWIAALSLPVVAALVPLVEDDPVAAVLSMGTLGWVGVFYTALCASVVAHSAFYAVVARNEVSLAVPTTLFSVVLGATLGITVLGEPFSAQTGLGALLTLGGIALLLWRTVRRRPWSAAAVTVETQKD